MTVHGQLPPFKPRMSLPKGIGRRLLNVRMKESAESFHRPGEEGVKQVLLLFAAEVEKMEAVQGPINTVSLWTGIALGVVLCLAVIWGVQGLVW